MMVLAKQNQRNGNKIIKFDGTYELLYWVNKNAVELVEFRVNSSLTDGTEMQFISRGNNLLLKLKYVNNKTLESFRNEK